jgi:hypothetical protein
MLDEEKGKMLTNVAQQNYTVWSVRKYFGSRLIVDITHGVSGHDIIE